MILINITQPAIEIVHLAYYIKTQTSSTLDTKELILYELVNVKYPHPEAPENAFIWNLEIREKGIYSEQSSDYSKLLVAYHAQKAINL